MAITALQTTPSPEHNLSVLAHANRFTLWHYRVDQVRDTMAPGHFDFARHSLEPGDQIHVSSVDGAALLYVRSVTDGGTTVAWLSLAEHANAPDPV